MLPGDLHKELDVRPLGRELSAQGPERILALEDLQDLLMEFRRRGRVGVDPVDLVPVPVEEQEERGPEDLVPLEDLFAGLGPSGGAIEDEIVFEELLVDGVGIVLLDQQFAGPSAAFLEEIEEQELVLGFCFGQGVFDRSGEPDLAVGRGGRQDEDKR
jgi:hypothetical protein